MEDNLQQSVAVPLNPLLRLDANVKSSFSYAGQSSLEYDMKGGWRPLITNRRSQQMKIQQNDQDEEQQILNQNQLGKGQFLPELNSTDQKSFGSQNLKASTTTNSQAKAQHRTLSDFTLKFDKNSNQQHSVQNRALSQTNFVRMGRRLKNSSINLMQAPLIEVTTQIKVGTQEMKKKKIANEYKSNIEFYKRQNDSTPSNVPQYFTNQMTQQNKRYENTELDLRRQSLCGNNADLKRQLMMLNQKQIPIVYRQSYSEDKEIYLSQFQKIYDDQEPNLLSMSKDSLTIDSQFESGNLREAYMQKHDKYLLMMREDTNTKGYYQWFYFSIRGMKKGQKFQYNLMNYQKSTSLFQQGMKPAVYSVKKSQNSQQKWNKNDTYGIKYKENQFFSRKGNRKLYILSFTYECLYDDDQVFFALTEPYTITRLKDFLTGISTSDDKLIKVESLTKSLLDIDIPIVTISPQQNDNEQKTDQAYIIICARVHPGEVQGSYVAEGIIQNLLQQKYLRKMKKHNLVFKIVPMLNPDGVLYGNTRTSLLGLDLNRKWDSPSATLQPSIYELRQLIDELKDKVVAFVDLHGHSKRYGSFFYGNQYKTIAEKLYSRQLPLDMKKNSLHKGVFSYESCRFIPGGVRDSSARVVVGKTMNIVNSFTLETSFYGYKNKGINHAFTEKDYFMIGECLIKSLFDLMDFAPDLMPVCYSPAIANKSHYNQSFTQRKQEPLKKSTEVQTQRQSFNEGIPDLSADDEDLDGAISESDSEVSLDELDLEERKQIELQAFKIIQERRQTRAASQTRGGISQHKSSSLVNITDLINHYKHLKVQERQSQKKLNQEAHKLRCTSLSTVNVDSANRTPNKGQIININGMINLKNQEVRQSQIKPPINSGQFNKFLYNYKNQQSKRQASSTQIDHISRISKDGILEISGDRSLVVAFEKMKIPKRKEVYSKLLKKGLLYQLNDLSQ